MAAEHTILISQKDSTCYNKWLRVAKWQGLSQFTCVLWQKKLWKYNILGYFSKTGDRTFNFLTTETLNTSWWVIRSSHLQRTAETYSFIYAGFSFCCNNCSKLIFSGTEL